MSYLVVVAHPDDEVLGAGATIYRLSQIGKEVNVCIMSAQAKARANRPQDNELKDDTEACMKRLGVKHVILGDFPNIMLNTVPHLELVQFIEKAIQDTGADVIITHHPEDLNNDHLHTSLACQEAARFFQRTNICSPLKSLLFMEVPSATEWSLNAAMNAFRPDTFVEVGKEGIKKKIEALSQYRNVMRQFPHPRSEECLMGLAAFRGGQSGCNYAEAFQTAIRRISVDTVKSRMTFSDGGNL